MDAGPLFFTQCFRVIPSVQGVLSGRVPLDIIGYVG